MSTESPSDLSVEVSESALMARVYDKISAIYDVVFGPVMQAGRERAVAVMGDTNGARVLEVGVGTGLNLSLYQQGTEVTGIDCSSQMLDRAEERAAREGLNARLFHMDAAELRFPDDSFDIVYAPYLIPVVPDPVRVLTEMQRVCKPGGRILVLNHFKSTHPVLARLEQWVSPFTMRIGFKADVDMAPLFERAGLAPEWIEKVNRPRIWTLAHCTRPARSQ